DPTQLAEVMYRTASPMLAREAKERTSFRLLGVGISGLTAGDIAEPPDMLDPDATRRAAAARAVDRLREKFGDLSISKGRGLRKYHASARTLRKESDLAEPCLDLESRIIQPKVGRDAIGKEREAHFEIGQPFRIVEIEIACMGVPPRKLFQQLAALHARSGRGRTGPGNDYKDALFFFFRPDEIDLLKKTIAPPHRLDPGTHGSNGEKRFRAERNHFLAFPFDGDAAILAPARDAAFTAGQFTPQILRQ